MHLTRPLFPHTHSREYLMHKYWSRKPHNIVASYIEQYSKEGDLVLDPFGGSGVTLNESLHLGRQCINVDIRYVMFVIDKYAGAHHLIEEMTLVQ